MKEIIFYRRGVCELVRNFKKLILDFHGRCDQGWHLHKLDKPQLEHLEELTVCATANYGYKEMHYTFYWLINLRKLDVITAYSILNLSRCTKLEYLTYREFKKQDWKNVFTHLKKKIILANNVCLKLF
jgi:hypothetical protein